MLKNNIIKIIIECKIILLIGNLLILISINMLYVLLSFGDNRCTNYKLSKYNCIDS